jgi:hypothetical protein
MKTHLRTLFFVLLVAFCFALPAHAQVNANAQANIDSLSTLPEAETLVYLNAPRIVNEALPRLLPEKENQELTKGLDQVKGFTGIDVRRLEFIVLAMRFNKPSGGMIYPLPEAMFAMRGDFDADGLLGMAMMFSEGKLRQESYGTHSLALLKLEDVQPGIGKNPFGAAFSELALTALDHHTIALGNTSYIKAALDAADGRGRIKVETIQSALREPDALLSISGSPLMAFAKSFGLRAAERRPDNTDCMTRFGDFYMGLNMDAQSFKLTGAMNADNPETANIIKTMFMGAFEQAKSAVPDKDAQAMLKQMNIIVEGSELLIQANIPQEMAAQFVRELFAPPKPKVVEATTMAPPKAEDKVKMEEKPAAKPKTKTRKSRRRK